MHAQAPLLDHRHLIHPVRIKLSGDLGIDTFSNHREASLFNALVKDMPTKLIDKE